MKAFVVAAARTLIAPKGGLHRDTPLHDLGAAALRRAWPRAWSHRRMPDMVILGNALAAGGNPARSCALAAFGSKEKDIPGNRIAAITVDSQCCSGMDAIALAASRILAGDAQAILAGGVESFSQAPMRARRTKDGFAPYTQASFTPWPECGPDVLQMAADFARRHHITRDHQEAFAIASHAKALLAPGLRDPYTRSLAPEVCARMPALVSSDAFADAYAVTAATVAPEADGAAVVLLVGETLAQEFPWAVEIIDATQVSSDPMAPPLAATQAAKSLLLKRVSAKTASSKSSMKSLRALTAKLACVEIMESFAAQAISTQRDLGIDAARMNRRGGMLAIGHPIGASGAVLVGNLFLELQKEPHKSLGLAAIAAAGGLGSAMLLRKP